MMRFTPIVALGGDDHLFLDLSGCERVFDGIDNIALAVREAMQRMGISAGIAVAPTLGAAYALAAFGKSQITNLQSEIADLPPASLRIDNDTAAALHHLGIETIGQLMAIPRQTLPARFGNALLLRLDQALGNVPEPLVPLSHHAPILASIEFEATVESLEVMWIALRQLLRDIAGQLTRRGCGAREILATFGRAYAISLEKKVELSRPSRNVKTLFELLRCALEHIETNVGFTGITLNVTRFERISEAQLSLVAQEEQEGREELDRLIERLIARLGKDAIHQPRLLESYLPERAWEGLSNHTARVENPCHENVRPLQLIAHPIEVKVMVSPSDDRDGKPILFRHRQEVHELRHAVGPERISGEWWRGHEKTRDYFDVEVMDGRRFWLFRVNETGKWFLHGMFS
jgi:protein ImuB